jgi:hypothetical protein
MQKLIAKVSHVRDTNPREVKQTDPLLKRINKAQQNIRHGELKPGQSPAFL